MGRAVITRHPSPDMDGDPVDVFPGDATLQRWVVDAPIDVPALARRVADALAALRHVHTRHRQLDVPIWHGRFVAADGRPMVMLATDRSAPATVRTHLGTALQDILGTSGFLTLRDLDSVPFARYDHGTVVLYKRSDETHDHERIHGLEQLPGVEWRAAQSSGAGWRSAGVPAGRTDRTPLAEDDANPVHDLAHWTRTRLRVVRALQRLTPPLDARRVAQVAVEVGGIAVHAEADPRFLRLGCIRLGPVSEADGAPVTILVNERLPEPDRCVVLLHELSHYVLHFPLLLRAQWVEGLSNGLPELEVLFAALAHAHVRGGLATLERQANLLTSVFLVPWPPRAWSALQRAHGIFDGMDDAPVPERIVRSLRPYFSELAPVQGWDHAADAVRLRQLGDREAGAAVDLNHATPGSLLRAIFAAVQDRDAGERVPIDEMSGLLRPLLDGFDAALADLQAAAIARAPVDRRAAMRDHLGSVVTLRVLAQAGAWSPSLLRRPTAPDEAAGELGPVSPGADRELVPPRGWDEPHMIFPRLALEPASWNLEGDPDGDWVHVDRREGPVGTIAEYLDTAPPGYGLALYRFTSWQKARVRRDARRLTLPPELASLLPPGVDGEKARAVLEAALDDTPDAQGEPS